MNILNFNTNKVTKMNGMFSCCSSLKRLYMPNFNTNNVNDMKNLFFLCPNEIKNKIRDKMAV